MRSITWESNVLLRSTILTLPSYLVFMSNEQEPAQVDAPKEPEVKYVLSGQPTGWWAAAKEVQEFDEQQVKSCKEDIDTLLVFVSCTDSFLFLVIDI